MSRPNPARLGIFVAIVLVLSAMPVWLKGGLYITNFEGDALHLADIVLRMAAGERPHLDFMTPIGALAFWPVVLFVRLGLDLGHAFAAGQALFAALAALPLWLAAATRLPPITAYAFTGATVLMLTSLGHGYDTAYLAVSMHYNRWAWALAFVATLLVLLPPRSAPAPLRDGAVAGALVAALAFVKITYFVAFAPVLFLIALIRGERVLLFSALAGGAGTAVLLTLGAAGPAQTIAYLGDLRAAATAPLRDAPGLGLPQILISPAYLAPTLTVVAGALVLRRSGRRAEGLSVLLLLPAFVFVTWQNFGNDPLWLFLAGAILAAFWDADRRVSRPLAAVALASFVLSVPPLAVHGLSGPRLLSIQSARYTPIVPERAGLSDLYMPNVPAHLVRARTVLNDEGQPFAALADRIERPEPLVVAGVTLDECQLLTGIKGAVEALASSVADRAVFTADILSSHWLYAGAPLPGASPWNYGTLHGFDSATHVLVPLCPVSVRARRAILDAIAGTPARLQLAQRTPTHLLLRIER